MSEPSAVTTAVTYSSYLPQLPAAVACSRVACSSYLPQLPTAELPAAELPTAVAYSCTALRAGSPRHPRHPAAPCSCKQTAVVTCPWCVVAQTFPDEVDTPLDNPGRERFAR